MTKETVSVIVPVYNIAAELPRCVESVLAQTWDALEVILVDDGSTDGSGSLCDSFARQDPRVRVIHQRNAGVSAARNAGVSRATGEYLAFVDSDDYVEPELYEKMVWLMGERQLDIGAFGWFINDTPAQAFSRAEAAELSVPETVANVIADGSDNLFIGAVWNKLYRRGTMQPLLRFDPALIMGEDMLVTLQCLTAASKVGQLTWSGYHYVQRESSIVHSYKKNKCSSAAAHEKMLELLEGKYPELCPLLKRRNIWQCFALLMEQIRGDAYYEEDVQILLRSIRRCGTELKNTPMNPREKLRLRRMLVIPGLPRLLHNLYGLRKTH